MTTDNRHKWECVSPGEYDTTYRCSKCGALHTDQADDLSSVIPEFGCSATTDRIDAIGMLKKAIEETPTTTDLKSMTVEERDALVYGPCEEDWKKTFPGGSRADAWCLFVEAWLLGYEHSARRLEEAQQKIAEAKAEALGDFLRHVMHSSSSPALQWVTDDLREKAAEYRDKAGRKE